MIEINPFPMKTVRCVLLIGLFLVISKASAETLTHNSNLRKAASSSSELLQELSSGTSVTLISNEKRGRYDHVKLADGRSGWVLAKNLTTRATEVPTSPAPTISASAKAQPSAKEQAANLPFTGIYRAGAKTSIVRTASAVIPITEYQNLSGLLTTLPKDATMRSQHPALKPGNINAPSERFPEEQRNVRIKDCWILVVKYEKSKITKTTGGKTKRTGDNDFHLVISSTPQLNPGQRMNMEVAGLPPTASADTEQLRKARVDFLNMCLKIPPAGAFATFTPAIHVMIEGSLFFDGEHTADQIAPKYHLTTTWEIHPISKITRLADH